MSLGERICRLRTAKKLSQGDLAEALEVSRQSISKWETNGSVPELDKLVKLSELFGVSLDELILDRKQTEIISDPESRIIYAEHTDPMPGKKIVGIVLLCFAALLWIITALLGDMIAGFVLASPFVVCGLLCMFVRRNAGLWCVWVIYLFIELYLRVATGVNWQFVFLPHVYTGGWTIHLVIAWTLWLSFVVLTVLTIVRFRKGDFASVRYDAILAAICWVVYLMTWLGAVWPGRDAITDVDQIRVFGFVSAVIGWIRSIVLVIALVFTTRMIVALREKRKHK